jgi:hypothetical protein
MDSSGSLDSLVHIVALISYQQQHYKIVSWHGRLNVRNIFTCSGKHDVIFSAMTSKKPRHALKTRSPPS